MTPAARQQFRKAGAATRIALRGDEVTYNGIVYNRDLQGTVSITPVEQALEEGGFRNVSELTWRVAKHILRTEPKPRQIVRYNDQDWIINTVSGQEAWKDEWTVKATQ